MVATMVDRLTTTKKCLSKLRTAAAISPLFLALMHCAYADDTVTATAPSATDDSSKTSNATDEAATIPRKEEWKLVPTISLTETYTDNVAFQPAGLAVSSLITQITPGIDIIADARKLKLDLKYSLQELHYSGEDSTTRRNNILAGTGTATVAENIFFLDGTANISQLNESPFAPNANDNLNLSTNRVEIRTYSLAPYLRHNFDQFASSELRYTYDSVTSSLGGFANSTAGTLSALLKSGSAFKAVDWNLNYSDQKIYYVDQSDVDMQSGILNLTDHLTPQFGLTASAGYEKNNYIALDGQEPQGATWSGGFVWTPTDRTSLSASAGKHYYGTAYTLSANERTRATVWTLGYNEAVTTSRSQFLVPATTNTSDFLNQLWAASIPDPALRQQIVNAFISSNGLGASLNNPVNTLSNQIFLQKSLQGSVALTGARNTILFTVFDVRRDALSLEGVNIGSLSGNVASLLDNTRQTGGNILWNTKFTARTDGMLMASYSHALSTLTNIIYNNKSLTATINYQMQPKLRATLQFSRVMASSNIEANDFNANSISLTFLLGF